MKNSLLTIAALGLALMSFSSCKKEAEQEIAPEMYEYTFLLKEGSQTLGATKSSLGEDETGLYLKWENNDQLTTITHSTVSGNSGYSYCQYSKVAVPTEETAPITFTIGSYRPLNKDDMVYCASPYISNPGSNPENVTMSVSNLQKQNGAVFNGKYLPMVSVPFPISSAIASSNGTSSEGEAVTFYSLGSVIEFDVFSPTGKYAGESIQKVTFTTSGTDYIAGNFSFDMTRVSSTNASALQIEGYTGQSVAVELDAALGISATNVDKDHAAKVYMVVAPGTHAGSLVVETDVAKYTYAIPSKEFQRAAVRRFGVNLEKEGIREEPKYYRLVDEAKEDYSGTYLVVYNSKAMNGSNITASSNTTTSVSISSGRIEETTATKSLEVTVASDGLYYTMKDKNGDYIYMPSTTSSIGVSSSRQNVDFEFSDSQLKCKTTSGVYLKGKDSDKIKFYTGANQLVSFYLLDGTGVNVTKVATPEISCESNTVSISCSTRNAVIYYTTDGSDPSSSNGSSYTEPFAISSTVYVRAIAVRSGLEDSDVAEQSCFYVAPVHNFAVSGVALEENENTVTLTLGSSANSSEIISVTSNYAWEVTELVNYGFTITEITGKSGDGTITIKANNANVSASETASLGSIKVYEANGTLEKTILIEQYPSSTDETAVLTYSEIQNNTNWNGTSYVTFTYENSYGEWGLKASKNSGAQINTSKNGSYVKTPTFSRPIKSVIITKGSGAGTVNLNDSASYTATFTGTTSGNVTTFTGVDTEKWKSLYIVSSGAFVITRIEVVY